MLPLSIKEQNCREEVKDNVRGQEAGLSAPDWSPQSGSNNISFQGENSNNNSHKLCRIQYRQSSLGKNKEKNPFWLAQIMRIYPGPTYLVPFVEGKI